ncbi:GTP cyclohydrolase II [Candidatus Micrarchaeota archaeon]|nr:GTP cyclohydrolase II [Candidatus Micrarchaeota archaeon]
MPVEHVADAFFPSRYGKFRIHAFRGKDGGEHIALVRCEHAPHGPVPVRIHSRCLTGDALTSERCDCRKQLEASMKYLEKRKCGILVYLDQEGRGIGLANKIKAYSLQDGGMDTVEANVSLGFGEDMRDFSIAADILGYFGVKDIALLTNNPNKIAVLEKAGIKVSKRIPLIITPNRFNKKYLDTKKEKMRHLL